MPIPRRALPALAAAALPAIVMPAAAQAWPTRPVRLIVTFPPGGPADVIGRILAERLSEAWGQPVIVENRGGAGGNIGAEAAARAAPDGHTLVVVASSHVQGAALYRRLPFDPIADFTPITQVAYYGLVVVLHPSVPAQNLAEFEALLRARPGEITMAHLGVLFLDEIAEFSSSTLESLRQPLEAGEIAVSRVGGTFTYPCRFALVAAMNPCPCGYFGTDRCRCTPQAIKKYQAKISGPISDRIDLQVVLSPLTTEERFATASDEESPRLRTQVEAARQRQQIGRASRTERQTKRVYI